MYREIVVQGRTRPLDFEVLVEGRGTAMELAGAQVWLSLVRVENQFLGRSEAPPYRSSGPHRKYVDEVPVQVLDQMERPGQVRWVPGDTLVEIPPADYAVQFRVRFAEGVEEVFPALGELVLEVVP